MILPYLAAFLLVIATIYSAVISFRKTPQPGARNWLFPVGTTWSARIVIGIATLILAVGAGYWLGIGNSKSVPRSFRFLIPEGYSGWVHIEFQVHGASPLPAETGKTVLKIPQSGVLKTSSPEQYGWARDEYFLYSGGNMRGLPDSGPGRLIWGKINGEKAGSSGPQQYEEFFVGTERQFKDQAEQARPETSPRNRHSPADIP